MVKDKYKTGGDYLKKLSSYGIDVSKLSHDDIVKVQELEERVEAMVKTTGGDYSLKVRPGNVWAMNVENRTMTYPIIDLITKGTETTLGYALHEGGHRDITRMIDKFWFTRETLRALYNVVEDPRVNTYEETKWPGSNEYLSKTYELEWPKLDSTKPIEYYDDYKVQPHLQFLNSIIYYYRHGVIDPRIKNQYVEEIFNKSINAIKNAYSKHPPTLNPSEDQKREAQRKMGEILKDKVLPEYEKLIAESAKIIEQGMLNGNIQLSLGPTATPTGIGTLSTDELTQKTRDYIEVKSKEIADKFEAKITRRDVEQLKDDIAKERKRQELNKSLNSGDGDNVQSLNDLMKQKIKYERLRNAQKSEWDKYYSPIASLVTTLIGLLENELTKDARPKYHGFFRTGKKIDMRKYLQYKASAYDPAYEKFWMQKALPSKPSINFTLVIDESGSMVEGERDTNALKSLVLFIELLNHFDLDFNIIGFSDTALIHKEFDEDITSVNKDVFIRKVFNHMGVGATDDSSALEMAVDTIIKESEADHKVILIISDGEGNVGKSKNAGIDKFGHYYNFTLKENLKKADRNGIDVIGIGIGEGIKYVPDIYAKSVVEERIDHLPHAFADLMIEKILEEKSLYSNVN